MSAKKITAWKIFSGDGFQGNNLLTLGITSSQLFLGLSGDFGGGAFRPNGGLDATNLARINYFHFGISQGSQLNMTVVGMYPVHCPYDYFAMELAGATDPTVVVDLYFSARI